jgi:hypothetical protein
VCDGIACAPLASSRVAAGAAEEDPEPHAVDTRAQPPDLPEVTLREERLEEPARHRSGHSETRGETGMWCGATTLGSSWSRVWGVLGGELRSSHDHVVELISRTPDLSIDLEADTITLTVPAPNE